MKHLSYLAVAILAGFSFAGIAHAEVVLTGAYDPMDAGNGGNDVDQSGSVSSVTGSATAANALTVGDFTTSVGNAFTAGTGGVISFVDGDTSDADGANLGGTLTTSSFGGTTLTFNATTGTSTNIGFGDGSGDRIPTSGGAVGGGRLGQAGSSDFNFTNFAFTGAAAGTGVTEFGVTLIHRNQNEHTWAATATFSDGSTLLFDPVTFPDSADVGSTSNSLDTFFGVVAPTGTTLTSLLLDRTSEGGSANTWVDDIGFVSSVVTTVPEPSSLAMGMLVVGLSAVRRRRK